MSDYEVQIKKEFDTLLKGGKTLVWGFIEEIEGYLGEEKNPNLIEQKLIEIVKVVRLEKKFQFNQFKELYPYLLSERKNKKEEEDDFILLD
jgi:hypothetical protein